MTVLTMTHHYLGLDLPRLGLHEGKTELTHVFCNQEVPKLKSVKLRLMEKRVKCLTRNFRENVFLITSKEGKFFNNFTV